jgi:hypothetical protein
VDSVHKKLAQYEQRWLNHLAGRKTLGTLTTVKKRSLDGYNREAKWVTYWPNFVSRRKRRQLVLQRFVTLQISECKEFFLVFF